jgi:uncharacterized protein
MAAAPPSDPSTWTLPRLRIDKDGVWYHEDAEVTHPGILASLREGLQRDAEGHHLSIGPVRVPVEVEDAPFVVIRAEADGEGLAVILNDGSREPLRPETLRLGAGEVPYCTVKDGRLEARLSRAAAYQLLAYMHEDAASGRTLLTLGSRRWEVPRRGSG